MHFALYIFFIIEVNMTNDNSLEAKLNIVKFPRDTQMSYTLGVEQDWVKDLLIELNEKADAKSIEEYLGQTSIEIKLDVIKKHKEVCGDYVLVKGQFEAKYMTKCVRTLVDMPDEISLEFKACFLEDHYEKEEAYADQSEIFQDDDMYELYFFVKKFADLAEMVHEQVYLNINQYPVADEETPLNWANETSDTKQ
jgi:uncharacterized metal-binding protein YceD (DUF177 family)